MNREPETAPGSTPTPSLGLVASPLRVDAAGLTHVGRVRSNNEDAFLVCRIGRFLEVIGSNLDDALPEQRTEESGHVMMVADGMGGHAGGEVASRTVIATVARMILETPKWTLRLDDPATRAAEITELEEQGREFVARLHEAVRARAATDPSLTGMGTTMTSAYGVGPDVFVFHLGDSRAYHLRERELRRITRDHTLAQQYVDLGLMRESEAEGGRLNHVLTRALGAPGAGPPADAHRLEVAPGDCLLLCTDGLNKVVGDDEIVTALRESGSSAEACRRLVDLALARGAPDNVTVVVAAYSAA